VAKQGAAGRCAALVEQRLPAPAARRPRAARSSAAGAGCHRRCAEEREAHTQGCRPEEREAGGRAGEPLMAARRQTWERPAVIEIPSLSAAAIACVPSASGEGADTCRGVPCGLWPVPVCPKASALCCDGPMQASGPAPKQKATTPHSGQMAHVFNLLHESDLLMCATSQVDSLLHESD
jgi:hypothetical protein